MAKAIKGPGTWMALFIRKLASLKKTHLSVNWCYDRAWCLDLGVFCFNLGSFSRNFWHFSKISWGNLESNGKTTGFGDKKSDIHCPLSPGSKKMALSDIFNRCWNQWLPFFHHRLSRWKRNCGKDHILGQHSERREISNQRLKNCDLILWS